MVRFGVPTSDQRSEFFRMILAQLGEQTDSALESLGLSREDFARLYDVTGEVRTISTQDAHAGYLWIELRERIVHIHGFILFEEMRGRGVGSQAVRALASEFERRAGFIELGVQESNPRAIRFYERLAFRESAVSTASGFKILRKRIAADG